jgi:hypothetical protein
MFAVVTMVIVVRVDLSGESAEVFVEERLFFSHGKITSGKDTGWYLKFF